jgi:hypothetical protein
MAAPPAPPTPITLIRANVSIAGATCGIKTTSQT